MAYYDSIGDRVVSYYMEKINMLLANQKVLEKVTEVSMIIKKEGNSSSLAKLMLDAQPEINIHKKKATDLKRFEFQKQISLIRKKGPGSEEDSEGGEETVKGTLMRFTKRIEFFQNNLEGQFQTQEKELQERINQRNMGVFKRNFGMSQDLSLDVSEQGRGFDISHLLKSNLSDDSVPGDDSHIIPDSVGE